MKLLKSVLFEFVYGGHLLSLGATAIVLTVILIFEQPVKFIILLIPYLISQIVYNYNHLYEIQADRISNPERTEHIEKKHKRMKILFIGYVFSIIILLSISNIKTIFWVTFIILGGILYTIYLKKLLSRYFAGFKNIYTSLFWAFLVFMIPFYYDQGANVSYFYMFLFVFFRLIVNTIFFDIKDIESDKKEGLKTFAVLLGKNKTLYLLIIINIISILPLIFATYKDEISNNILILLVFMFYSFFYIIQALNSDTKKLRIISYIMVDAEYFFWPLIIIVGDYLK